ncbi:hypothetical protein [Laspinema palackyanum]|nr:hypothetical protein [Laspinema sp. D2c]
MSVSTDLILLFLTPAGCCWDPWSPSVAIARGWSVGTKTVTVPGNASIL